MEQSPPGTPFIVLSLLTRSIEALGSAAFLTSGRAIASNIFPDNVAMIYVSKCICLSDSLSIDLLRNICYFPISGLCFINFQGPNSHNALASVAIWLRFHIGLVKFSAVFIKIS